MLGNRCGFGVVSKVVNLTTRIVLFLAWVALAQLRFRVDSSLASVGGGRARREGGGWRRAEN